MKSVLLRTNVVHSKWYLLDRGNTGDIRLLSWGKFFTVQFIIITVYYYSVPRQFLMNSNSSVIA